MNWMLSPLKKKCRNSNFRNPKNLWKLKFQLNLLKSQNRLNKLRSPCNNPILKMKTNLWLRRKKLIIKFRKRTSKTWNPFLLHWMKAKSATLLKLTLNKNLKKWCQSLWKKLNPNFWTNLKLSLKKLQRDNKKLFINTLLVTNVVTRILKVSDISALFVPTSIFVKDVKSSQHMIIHFWKLSTQDKLHTRFSPS